MAAQRGFQPKNGEIFNPSGSGQAIFNGFTTTRTRQSPTLFVTNLPRDLPVVAVQAMFQNAPGFQQVRTVRHMVFADFFDVRTATSAMQLCQNARFEGFEDVRQGIMIDYDKDARVKRNKAFSSGNYQQGLDRDSRAQPFVAAADEHVPRALLQGQHPAGAGGVAGGGDPTLKLIAELKRNHQLEAGVEVPLHAPEPHPRRLGHASSGGAASAAGGLALPKKDPDAGLTSGAALPQGRLVARRKRNADNGNQPKKKKKKSKQKNTPEAKPDGEYESTDAADLPQPPSGALSLLVGYGSDSDGAS